ncbi:hypothetical protein [Paraburkholderia sp. BL21I4N1]|nr:hypothetical protein [Paraburkholderia sp. BL21I4N1]
MFAFEALRGHGVVVNAPVRERDHAWCDEGENRQSATNNLLEPLI